MGNSMWVALRRSPPLYPDAVTLLQSPNEQMRHLELAANYDSGTGTGTVIERL